MSLKAKVEAIIYATEEPVTLNELAALLKDAALADLRATEEARLALNETVSDGSPVPEADEALEFAAALEDAAAEFANEASMTAEAAVADPVQLDKSASAPTEKRTEADGRAPTQLKAVKARVNAIIDDLTADYASSDRGMEIRPIAGGYRMATKPEHHDVVVSFAKSLKPPVRLSLQALETLSVIAYKQPVTVPEISEIRGVDSAGVIATLLDRKLITTAGRKQVIGRPILYKTTKEFLMRFGLNDVSELPSTEEFEKLGEPQAELFSAPATESASLDATSASEAASEAALEAEPVTEAVPEQNADSSLMGETDIPADGTFATEAEPEKS